MATVKSRREEISESTRRALLASARALFADKGYAAVSLDEIAAAARMTKGALYHHFSGKEDVFAAVYDDACSELMAEVVAAIGATKTPWRRALVGLSRWLEGCAEPRFRRIALEDAPGVLGRQRWREIDERHAGGVLRAVLEDLMEQGEIERLPVDVLARVLFGALCEGAMAIASAKDTKKATAEVEKVLARVLEGLRPRR